MSKIREKISQMAHAGIRISGFNILLIIIGLVLSLGIIITTYRTEDAFRSVFSASSGYMDSQQTTGMLDSLSTSMAAECRAFLEDGDPSHVFSFKGQLDTLNEQLAAAEANRAGSGKTEADTHLDNALAAFREMNRDELRAMRLHAEMLHVPMNAYPELLQEVELSEEDLALSPAEKSETAAGLLTSDAFTALKSLMESEISLNHRLNSEISRQGLDEAEDVVSGVVLQQKVFAFLFILFAVLALVVNHVLLVRPIRHSVRNLDRREEIPVQGSYEVRHLAATYNNLLEENNRKQDALAYTASHDALTDVLNRGAFEELYHSDAILEYDALIIADVDHFKYYNDSHGHDIGDRVLQAVTRTIREHIREDDLIFRIGGDEFVILLKKADRNKSDRILEIVNRINRKLSSGDEEMLNLTISAGIAFRADLKEGEDLFKCADTALLQVKENGRSGSAVYHS